MEEEGEGEIFGSYCVYQHDNTTGVWNISVAVYANAASAAANPAFGNIMLNSIAQTITGTDELNIRFTNKPLKINKILLPGLNAGVATMIGIGILTFSSFVVVRMAENFAKPLSSQFYDVFLIRGGTSTMYVLSHLLIDVLLFWLLFLLAFAILELFSFGSKSLLVVFAFYSLVAPLSGYTFAYVACQEAGKDWTWMGNYYAQGILVAGLFAELVPEILTKA